VPGLLRAKDKLVGLDKWAGLDKMHTEAANMVFSATATIMKFRIANNI